MAGYTEIDDQGWTALCAAGPDNFEAQLLTGAPVWLLYAATDPGDGKAGPVADDPSNLLGGGFDAISTTKLAGTSLIAWARVAGGAQTPPRSASVASAEW